MGKYIGHRLVARPELDNTSWTDSTGHPPFGPGEILTGKCRSSEIVFFTFVGVILFYIGRDRSTLLMGDAT